MSVHPHLPTPVPADTQEAARAAFRRGNPYVALRDALGPLVRDADLMDLYSQQGRPVLSPGMLATVMLLQFAEGMSDAEAAEAVRSRIDWKYLLGLGLQDAGFDASVLTEFRDRLVAGGAEMRLLDLLLTHATTHKLIRVRGAQRTDATHVVAAIRTMHRLEMVTETFRAALNALAVAAPAWFVAHADPAWVDRYEQPWDRGPSGCRRAKDAAARRARAVVVGQDGQTLLTAIQAEAENQQWAWLAQLPAISTLEAVWEQQYVRQGQTVQWRPREALPAAHELIWSPYDPDARVGEKREQTWVGYKAHLTETCEPDLPHLITQVTTTVACVPDVSMLADIQADLVARDRAPGTQVVDAGYVDAANRVGSTTQGITIVAPTTRDTSWQARAGAGYALTDFAIHWEEQYATCPQGKKSATWRPMVRDTGTEVIQVHYHAADCQACPVRAQCTTAIRRSLTIRPREQHEGRVAALADQQTSEFAERYAVRAGIEGTLSEAVREQGLRRTRYHSLAKTRLCHAGIGAGLTLRRLGTWFLGMTPTAKRRPRFAVLLAPSPA